MRYISIDIETTGLETDRDQILSIGAIIEDTNNPKNFEDIPKFHGVIKRNRLEGGLFAIDLNRDLIHTMNQYATVRDESEKFKVSETNGVKFYEESEIVKEFYYWLAKHFFVDFNNIAQGNNVVERDGVMLPAITNKIKPIHITAAGKNFATFDKLFLERLPRWKQLIKIRQRILDPSILFVDWKNDESLPGMEKCKKRAGFDEFVSHNALEDAWDVVELLRKDYD